jgi:hypothetical protein
MAIFPWDIIRSETRESMVGVNAPGWNARKPACAKTSTQFTHVFFRPDCSFAADALQGGGTGTRRSKIMAFGHSFSPLFDGSPCGSFAVHAFNGRMAAPRAHRFDSEPIL